MSDFKSDYDTGYADAIADWHDNVYPPRTAMEMDGSKEPYWHGYLAGWSKLRDEGRDKARPWYRNIEPLSGELVTLDDFSHLPIGIVAGDKTITQGMVVVRNVDGSIGPYMPPTTPPAIGYVMTRRRGWVERYGPIIVLALYMVFRLTGSVPV